MQVNCAYVKECSKCSAHLSWSLYSSNICGGKWGENKWKLISLFVGCLTWYRKTTVGFGALRGVVLGLERGCGNATGELQIPEHGWNRLCSPERGCGVWGCPQPTPQSPFFISPSPSFILCFFFNPPQDDIFSLPLTKRQKKGEGETSVWERSIIGCLPQAPGLGIGESNLEQRYGPWPGIKPTTFWLLDEVPTNWATAARTFILLLYSLYGKRIWWEWEWFYQRRL